MHKVDRRGEKGRGRRGKRRKDSYGYESNREGIF